MKMNKHTKSLVICVSLVMIIKKHTRSFVIFVIVVMKIKNTYKKLLFSLSLLFDAFIMTQRRWGGGEVGHECLGQAKPAQAWQSLAKLGCLAGCLADLASWLAGWLASWLAVKEPPIVYNSKLDSYQI